jgi:tetratricopeptide (TPR) repeat protein
MALMTATAFVIAAPVARGQSSGAVSEARQLFAAGEQAFRAGRWSDALERFSAAFKLDPRPEFLYELARTHQKLGQLDEAIANCESFLALTPNSPRAADVWKLKGELQQRKKAAERGRSAADEGARLANAGDWNGALAAYQQASFFDPDEPQYTRKIGDCMKELHRDGEAVRFYKLFLHQRPADPDRVQLTATVHELEHPATKTKPAWKQWWVWTAIGLVAVVVVGVGLGVGLGSQSSQSSSFMSTLPSFGPGAK